MSSQSGFLKIVQVANRFHREGSMKKLLSRPFYIESTHVGYVEPAVLEQLGKYPEAFQVIPIQGAGSDGEVQMVKLNPSLKTFEERSAKMADVLSDMREKDLFVTLRGWRNEMYSVWSKFSEPPLMEMERAATCLFGIKQYGVHINGYVNHSSKGLSMWIARRSKTKQTFPSKLDQMVAGGLASGQSVMECASKECKEEASVPDELIAKLKPVGVVSYFYEDERGLFAECQYVMDLEVPEDFEPVNADGEAESFELVPIEKVKELIIGDDFKFNCALVVLDFLVRHGFVSPDNEPNYSYLVEQMHMTLF